MEYPPTRRDEEAGDTLHGVKIADPYRWLEDPDAAETREWVVAQNKVTASVIGSVPFRSELRAVLEEQYNYARISLPWREGKEGSPFCRWYFWHNTGLQNQPVLRRCRREPLTPADVAPENTDVFFDANTLNAGGTTAVNTSAFSDDGSMWAYALQERGSDWCTVHVRSADAAPGDPPLADKLEFVKFTSLAWTHDNAGFYYTRYPAPPPAAGGAGTETAANENHMLCYHRIGTPQADDPVVMRDAANPKWMFGAEVTDDGAFLILSVSRGCDPENLLKIARLGAGSVAPAGGEEAYTWVTVVGEWVAEVGVVWSQGARMLLSTTLDAPRRRVVLLDDCEHPPADVRAMPTVVGELEGGALLESAYFSRDAATGEPRAWVVSLRDVTSHVHTALVPAMLAAAAAGEDARKLLLAVRGIPPSTLAGMTASPHHSRVFARLTSAILPGSVFDLTPVAPGTSAPPPREDGAGWADFAAGLWWEPEVAGFKSSDFVCEQVFVPGEHGARLPMFVVRAATTPLDGTAPLLLYAYGGFRISMKPSFSTTRLPWIARCGGVWALACVRGGLEYGDAWHEAGRKLRKQQCISDVVACVRWLHANSYSSPARTAVQGDSNGGMVMCAVANQAPDDVACVVAGVPVCDLTRFHLFTIGAAWRSDFGDPEVAEEFGAIRALSPLHNVPEGRRMPAMLLCTADHDDRVVPLHAFKHLATLQHLCGAASGARPLVARIEVDAGHGAGKPTAKVLDEQADVYAFIARSTGATWHPR